MMDRWRVGLPHRMVSDWKYIACFLRSLPPLAKLRVARRAGHAAGGGVPRYILA